MKPKKKILKKKIKEWEKNILFLIHLTTLQIPQTFFLSFINLNKKQMGERKYRKNLNVKKQDRKKLCNCSIRL